MGKALEKSYDKESINPSHYKVREMECIDEMVVVFGKNSVIDFCLCNAWKYRYRAGHKDNIEQDLAKSDWYLAKAKQLQDEMHAPFERRF